MFSLKLANYNFTIKNKYAYIERLCEDYKVQEQGMEIEVSDLEIDRENIMTSMCNQGYLESLAIYRKICESLLKKDIILFHCSALVMDGRGYLFTAPSGTGKSTHTRLWREYFGKRVMMINDDKPLVSVKDGQTVVYGTPYAGKENIQNNISATVKGIVVISQGKENRIRKMSKVEAFPSLLESTYRQKGKAEMIHTMNLVERLCEIPVYFLECTISKEAVKIAYEKLKQG